MREPTLCNYVNRIKFFNGCIEKHPEMRENLEQKIKENERYILDYVMKMYDGGNCNER